MSDLDDLSLYQNAVLGRWMVRYERAYSHARAEGIDLASVDVLDSYDRTEHPWMHGRRGYDLVDYLRGLIGR